MNVEEIDYKQECKILEAKILHFHSQLKVEQQILDNITTKVWRKKYEEYFGIVTHRKGEINI